MQGHRLPSRNAWPKVVAYGVLQGEQPLIAQLHDRGGSKLLRERSQSEFRLKGVWSFPLRIGVAIAFGQENIPILGDENSTGEVIAVHLYLHVAVELAADRCRIDCVRASRRDSYQERAADRRGES